MTSDDDFDRDEAWYTERARALGESREALVVAAAEQVVHRAFVEAMLEEESE